MQFNIGWLFAAGAFALSGCSGPSSADQTAAPASAAKLTGAVVGQRSAYIPPQCYTRTEDDAGRVHNPCYTCHSVGRAPNYFNDAALQLQYALPKAARENPWTNLFVDRSAQVAAISDDAILEYVRQDNYTGADGELTLAQRLADLPANWDLDGDRRWDGYVPDAGFHFDADGFDHSADGTLTGWRAFAYYPFPGTFWPTNGSTDDVMVRLGDAFRRDARGRPDLEVYRVNLAIVEALIKQADVAIAPVDERALDVDLDKDGELGTARRIAFDWAPREGRDMTYVGAAKQLQRDGTVHLAAGLFPEGTEFLHSVRYIDLDAGGRPRLAPRMKELRYARKGSWYTYSELQQIATRETRERVLDAHALHNFPGDMERGLFRQGWRYQGFIEDAGGELRPQTREETVFCMGCHGGLSVTDDTIFSFGRKLDAATAPAGGWYHWSQHSLAGIAEPRRPDGRGEYTLYLEQNRAGDELRANDEILRRFLTPTGDLNDRSVEALHQDVIALLWPSAARALTLDKAYLTLVRDQSFVLGRVAPVAPASTVWKRIDEGRLTGVTEPVL